VSDVWIFVLIAVTVIVGYYARLLTISGALSASIVGFLVVLGLGLEGLIILGMFFVSSSLWSKVKNLNKQKAEELLVKGSQRDWQQVAANGGTAAVVSTLYYFTNEPVWLLGFCICIAAANSDTWASEIGSMSKERPFYIKTFKRVERGTSGAVSFLGTMAAAAGSFFIAFAALLFFDLGWNDFFFIFILGFLGNLIDTFLGAFIQIGYQCSHCGLQTEKRTHCGKETNVIKGFSFFNNDMINFLSVFFVLILAILIRL
jgi:uncharacterized protein (TIGR00297 family)